MLGASFQAPDDLRADIGQIRTLTDRSFGINLLLRWDQRERLDVSLDAGVRIVSFFWSDRRPIRPYVEAAQAAGALVMHTVGTADEARRAVDDGVDVLVAQGSDAGGHLWGEIGTLSLIPVVVDAVAPTPVIAAGGITDGRGLAAILALGAQAAWMGTRFVVAHEARSHPEYRDRLIAAAETDAVRSIGVFDRGFEDAPVRTIDNSTLVRWRDEHTPDAESRPGEHDVIAHRETGDPVMRYDFAPPVVGMTGDLEGMANYSGQGVGLVRKRQAAAEIVKEVAADAVTRLDEIRPSAG
jgi:nitronate monooxygenase